MLSLIISIVSIALIVAVTALSLYYGGAGISDAKAQAESARLKNEETQIMAAVDAFEADTGHWPENIQELVSRGYLTSVPQGAHLAEAAPSIYTLLAMIPRAYAQSAPVLGWATPLASEAVFTTEMTVPLEVCRKYNRVSRGDDGILRQPFSSLRAQCFGADGHYTVVISKPRARMLEALSPVQVFDGGLPAPDGSGTWWDTAPNGPVKVPLDPEKVPVAKLSLRGGAEGFGSVQRGGSAAAGPRLVANTGNAELTGLELQAPKGFELFDNACGTKLPPGADCGFSLRFVPTESRAYSANVVVSSANGGTANLAVTGTGVDALAALEGASFGDVQVGEVSVAKAVLRNTGIGPLAISTSATQGAEFAITGTNCGAQLPVNGQCDFDLRFTPAGDAGPRAGTLVVHTSAGEQRRTLSGGALAPVLEASSASLLGATLPPETQSGANLRFVNTGKGRVTITGAPTSAGSVQAFVGTTAEYCVSGKVLNPGENCAIFGFVKAAAGNYTGSISVPSTAGLVTKNLTATVTGQLQFGATTFPAVAMGETAQADVTVTNNASTAAAGLAFEAHAPFTLVSHTCGTTLAAGASCAVKLRGSPTSTTATSAKALTASYTLYSSVDGREERSLVGDVTTASASYALQGLRVDNSALLASYVNPVVTAPYYAPLNNTLGETLYSFHTGGTYWMAAGDFNVGGSVDVGGNQPVKAKLRFVTDDALPVFKVNGKSVSAASGSSGESSEFDLQPGTNSLEFTVRNGGGPGYFVAQVWSADGAAQLRSSSGYRYSNVVPKIDAYDAGSGWRYSDQTYAASCRAYRSPENARYAPATADGVYEVQPTPGGSVTRVLCNMTAEGGGWTLVMNNGMTTFTNNSGTGTNTICTTLTGCDTDGTSQLYRGTPEESRIRDYLFTATNRNMPMEDYRVVLVNARPFIRENIMAPGVPLYTVMTDSRKGYVPEDYGQFIGSNNDPSRYFYSDKGAAWHDGNWHNLAGQEGMQVEGWGHHHFTGPIIKLDNGNWRVSPWTMCPFFCADSYREVSEAQTRNYRWTAWVR